VKSQIKYIIIGFIFGLVAQSCDSNMLQADNQCNDYLGERGATEWNPIYVKIVE
tara:strand:- start:5524 stop:5685 length:162 start_codon:yes stop_codon:yes gene_type:complete